MAIKNNKNDDLVFWMLEKNPAPKQKQMSPFSRKVRRKILIITGLSFSFKCLVKFWRRLLWELLENT